MNEDPQKIIRFFQENIVVGQTLYNLSKVLKKIDSLEYDQIDVVTAIEGEIPVTWKAEDTIIVFRFLPHSTVSYPHAVYLRVSGKISRFELIQLLRGKPTENFIKNSIVEEIGFS